MSGFKFRRQFSVERYIVDFYCPKARLAIEVDGASHESPGAMAYDQMRQAEIEAHGIRFLRFTDDEVFGGAEDVLRRIAEAIKSVYADSQPPPPSPSST